MLLAENPDAPFDGVSEMFFEDEAAMAAAFATDAGKAAGGDAAGTAPTASAWSPRRSCSSRDALAASTRTSSTPSLPRAGYLADETLVTALYLALELGKPLLLEGVPGVGKTEVANRLAAILGRHCIRLQCYEGIDAAKALYDWDHARQLLAGRRCRARRRHRYVRPLRRRVPDRDAAAQGACATPGPACC